MLVPRRRTTTAPRGRLVMTAPRAPSLRLTTIVPRRPRTIVAPRGRLTMTAPRAPGARLAIIVPRRPRTIVAPRAAGRPLTTVVPRRPRTIVRRGLLMITAPRAPRRPRLTTAVPRRPLRIVAPRVRFTTAVPRGPLTIDVSRTAALALGTSMAMIPKNAVTPRAASADKRMLPPWCGLSGSSRIRRTLFGKSVRRFTSRRALRIYRKLFRNISGFSPILRHSRMFRSRTHT